MVNYIRATWAGPWVELLLWRPQRAVPALHGALWGWVRLAVAGVAGAHERPLALLLLHLGAAQRAHDAAAGRAPAACATCDAHMRAVLRGGRARGGCDLEALLAQLPLGGVASRAWSMRLGVQLLELAATDFSGADTGHAPVAAWAAAAEASGAAARPELPTHAACWLPPSLLHLLRWLADRLHSGLPGAEAEAETRATEHLRRCLRQPGAARLCERLGETPPLLTRRWTALAEMESEELTTGTSRHPPQ